MVTRVFALGANPHTSAPLFFSKPEDLKTGLRRGKIVKHGDYYFRAKMTSYIPGPKPDHQEPKKRKTQPSRLPFLEIPGLKFRIAARPQDLVSAVPKEVAFAFAENWQITL